MARHPAARLAFASANERAGTIWRFGGEEVRFVAADDAKLGVATHPTSRMGGA